MTNIGCAEVKDLLPAWVRGETAESDRAAIAAHVAACESCSEEVELLETIRAAGFSAPQSLASDIKALLAAEMGSGVGVGRGRVGRGSRTGRERWAPPSAGRLVRWALPAAATAVLAIGTGVIWQRTQALPEVGPLGQDPFAVVWPSDDADVAGVPMLADLSDEDLALLLQELGG